MSEAASRQSSKPQIWKPIGKSRIMLTYSRDQETDGHRIIDLDDLSKSGK
jgi:hypothetical protein